MTCDRGAKKTWPFLYLTCDMGENKGHGTLSFLFFKLTCNIGDPPPLPIKGPSNVGGVRGEDWGLSVHTALEVLYYRPLS